MMIQPKNTVTNTVIFKNYGDTSKKYRYKYRYFQKYDDASQKYRYKYRYFQKQ
ncbi:hypothetical protein [Circoviridae sp.]|nr:hypothetical protein [Circoviridae sp.]